MEYAGRLQAHLPALATRLLLVKADGSVLVHADGGSFKPLNWMWPPCLLRQEQDRWTVTGKSGETLAIDPEEILDDASTTSARIRAWPRTAWRRTCRSCWPAS